MKTQVCILCGKRKPLGAYYTHPMMANGRLGRCKECHRNEINRLRREDPEKYRLRDRIRGKGESRKKAIREKNKRKSASNPMYNRCHNALLKAVRTGDIVRPDHCTRCMINCSPQAHHDDYSKPLEVMFLCPICHAHRHLELGRLRTVETMKPSR